MQLLKNILHNKIHVFRHFKHVRIILTCLRIVLLDIYDHVLSLNTERETNRPLIDKKNLQSYKHVHL